MPRGRRPLHVPMTRDVANIVGDTVHVVMSVLREHGVSVPLPAMIAAAQAAERLVEEREVSHGGAG